MHRYIEAYEDDLDNANEIFIDELKSYSQDEIIKAIDTYLNTHDKCRDFALILINQGKTNE